MKINDIGEKEMERPSITEKEISKIKELSAAPLESADSEFAKEKLNEAKDVMSQGTCRASKTPQNYCTLAGF